MGDEETPDRIKAVYTSFGKPLDEIAGWQSLSELLPEEALRELEIAVPTIHTYHDTDGKPLYRVLRWGSGHGKRFKAQHWTPTGWKDGLGNVQPVLYRLPQVQKAAREGNPISIVEGEKCADALARLGLPATTNPFGAGAWRAEYAEQLQGARETVILPDNDQAGRKHADKVHSSLTAAGIPARIVELPGLKLGKDVVDWLAEHTKGELLAVINGEPADEPTPAGEPKSMPLTFPKEAAVGICAEIADLFARHFEAPFSFWYFAALTCLGVAVSGAVKLASALEVQPRLYTVVIGPTAAPRKSTALRHTVRFFADALGDLTPHAEHGLGSGEGLAASLSEIAGTKRCLLVLDELRLLAQKAKIEHSALLPMLCSLFELNHYSSATRKSRVKLFDAHLGILSACTEDTYDTMWAPEFLHIGFLNRLWLVPDRPDRMVALPPELPREEVEALQAKLRALAGEVHRRASTPLLANGQESGQALPAPIALQLTGGAQHRWELWYTGRPTGIHAHRLDTYGLRLMLLTEISRGNLETIEADTVERVVKLLGWQHQVRQLHDPVDADNRMAALEEKIRRRVKVHGAIGLRDLRRAVHADRAGNWFFERALQNLSEAGEARVKGSKKHRVVIWSG